MLPTLEINQRVLVNRFIYRFTDPAIGDIIVFHPPTGAVNGGRECGARRDPGQACPESTGESSNTNFIKRIVAGPGDRLRIENGAPVVNGERAEEDFIRPCGGGPVCNLREEITIPEDQYFMMGDNRGGSDDSRYWGPIERDWIVGKAFATYWPPKRIGIF